MQRIFGIWRRVCRGRLPIGFRRVGPPTLLSRWLLLFLLLIRDQELFGARANSGSIGRGLCNGLGRGNGGIGRRIVVLLVGCGGRWPSPHLRGTRSRVVIGQAQWRKGRREEEGRERRGEGGDGCLASWWWREEEVRQEG